MMSDAKEIKTQLHPQDDLVADMDDQELRMDVDELEMPKVAPGEQRFLVVSSLARFASQMVFDGMVGALRDLGFSALPYPMDRRRADFSVHMMFNEIIAMSVSVRNMFTHVMFVGAPFIPEWVIQSIQRAGVKVIYWSLEDPHALDQNHKFLKWADYYFTNEVTVSRKFENAYYLPTAGNAYASMPPKQPLDKLEPVEYRQVFNNDIVFCGNVYPNRQKVLEAICPFLEQRGYRFGIIGITALMEDREKSPLLKHIIEFKDTSGKLIERLEGVIDHRWLNLAHGYAKIALNFERDPDYVYDERFSTNREFKLEGESLNPRAYEIALSGGSLQLIDTKRKELGAKSSIVPGIHCVKFDDTDELCEQIDYYMKHANERKKIVNEARKYAKANHTYRNRAERLLRVIQLKEGDHESLKKRIMEGELVGKKIKMRN